MQELEQTGCFYDLRTIDRANWQSEVPDHIALPFQGIPICQYIENSFGIRCCDADTKAETGLFLFAPVIPFDGSSVTLAYNILEKVATQNDVPISASMNLVSPTTVDLVISISFVRTNEAASRVHKVKEVLHREFRKHGFNPYRIDIEHHDPKTMFGSQTRIDLLRTLKLALDPNNIIAPGRYVSIQ